MWVQIEVIGRHCGQFCANSHRFADGNVFWHIKGRLMVVFVHDCDLNGARPCVSDRVAHINSVQDQPVFAVSLKNASGSMFVDTDATVVKNFRKTLAVQVADNPEFKTSRMPVSWTNRTLLDECSFGN